MKQAYFVWRLWKVQVRKKVRERDGEGVYCGPVLMK